MEIVAIIASVVSIVIAALSLLQSRKAIRLGEKNRNEDKLESDLLKAAQISARTEFRFKLDDDLKETPCGNILVVENTSDHPVNNVRIRAVMNGRMHEVGPFTCPAGKYFFLWEGYSGSTSKTDWSYVTNYIDLESAGYHSRPYSRQGRGKNWSVAEMVFTDHVQRQWRRIDGDSTVEEVLPSEGGEK